MVESDFNLYGLENCRDITKATWPKPNKTLTPALLALSVFLAACSHQKSPSVVPVIPPLSPDFFNTDFDLGQGMVGIAPPPPSDGSFRYSERACFEAEMINGYCDGADRPLIGIPFDSTNRTTGESVKLRTGTYGYAEQTGVFESVTDAQNNSVTFGAPEKITIHDKVSGEVFTACLQNAANFQISGNTVNYDYAYQRCIVPTVPPYPIPEG